MSVARHHADWLRLVDVNGAFLSLPVLTRALPNGLPPLQPGLGETFQLAHDEWLEGRDVEEAAELNRAWVEFVLTRVLDFDEQSLRAGESVGERACYTQREHRETLQPDYVVVDPMAEDGPLPVRLLVQVWGREQPLDSAPRGLAWAASPEERMVELCRATGVRLGLVTNGSEWMLVDAPVGRGVTTAIWYASDWRSEVLSLRAFIACLGVSRFFGAEDETLEALLDDALTRQQEVTVQLGNQVRRAVEVLVQAIDRADIDRNRELLTDVEPKELYDGALTVMMRLVFLLAAEERELLLLGDPTYDQHYAISTLRGQLREAADQHGLEVLERRRDAWVRLFSTFRAVYGGVKHERLRLPPLGGSLFDPDRFPFLEGRKEGTSWRDTPARPLPIDNRTVLHLLDSLQQLELSVGAGTIEAQRLSFRGLDIEQVGHVYEGLLDHTAIRVDESTLGLRGAKGLEPEVGIGVLESASSKGQGALVAELERRSGRSAAAVENDLRKSVEEHDHAALLRACGNDESVFRRVLPYFHLLRADVWGAPQVYLSGSFVVTSGDERGQTGTHYTPRSLTEKIVAETLEPLVYDGPSDGLDREQWRVRAPETLLDLKICDPAMGSGAFLVRACEWLAERLVESWAEEEQKQNTSVASEQMVSDGVGRYELLPASNEDRLLHARRLIAERCLYGVDVNPMAVELAKLSLWLVTLSKGRPFGFLDHNLRCGDSLLGVHDIEQLRNFHIHPERGRELHKTPLFDLAEDLEPAIQEALAIRTRLVAIDVRDITDIEAMAQLDKQAKNSLERLRILGDAVIGAALAARGKWGRLDKLLVNSLVQARKWLKVDADVQACEKKRYREWFATDATTDGNRRQAFHWAIEYPEVFLQQGGFDALVGNPPFLGGKRLTGAYGNALRDFLVNHIAGGRRGSADLVAYFFLRAHSLLRGGGTFGLLGVNTIAEGDTRQVALEPILESGSQIFAAYPNEAWPGQAAVVTSRIHLHKGPWTGKFSLGQLRVRRISAFLSAEDDWSPKPLVGSEGVAFIGPVILGMGFTVSEKEAKAYMTGNPRCGEVLLPYVNGQDLNSHPEQRASRWVINFWDWPLSRTAAGSWSQSSDDRRNEWLRRGYVPKDFPGYVAEDFPELLSIVRRRVKPERDVKKRRVYREKWWRFGEPVPGAFHAIGRGHAFFRHPKQWSQNVRPLRRILLCSRVSKFLCPTFVANSLCPSDATVVFALQEDADFGLLQSCVHTEWAWKQSSRMKRDLRYTPSDILETFPFPVRYDQEALSNSAGRYHTKRADYMREERVGLTRFNNRLHDAQDSDERLDVLRRLQAEMDQAICDAYQWSDIELGHEFHEVDYLPENDRVRFTISESARLEILRRLSALNRERYDEEVKAGLHDKRRKTKKKATRKSKRRTSTSASSPSQQALDL